MRRLLLLIDAHRRLTVTMSNRDRSPGRATDIIGFMASCSNTDMRPREFDSYDQALATRGLHYAREQRSSKRAGAG
jgi:hypothetical protein